MCGVGRSVRSGVRSPTGGLVRAAGMPRRGGFTIVDLLVSVAVLMVLISLMMPAIRKATETAHRVVCASNVRQIGIGLLMYADTHEDLLVPTAFYQQDENRLEDMMALRLSGTADSDPFIAPELDGWDGLGILFSEEYLADGKVFYCPSHHGSHPFSQYASCFGGQPKTIVANYHYRGVGPEGQQNLTKIEPRVTALVSDGMRTRSDYNHKVGSNVLRADLSVTWYRDETGALFRSLPLDESQASTDPVAAAWDLIDGQLDATESGQQGENPS